MPEGATAVGVAAIGVWFRAAGAGEYAGDGECTAAAPAVALGVCSECVGNRGVGAAAVLMAGSA